MLMILIFIFVVGMQSTHFLLDEVFLLNIDKGKTLYNLTIFIYFIFIITFSSFSFLTIFHFSYTNILIVHLMIILINVFYIFIILFMKIIKYNFSKRFYLDILFTSIIPTILLGYFVFFTGLIYDSLFFSNLLNSNSIYEKSIFLFMLPVIVLSSTGIMILNIFFEYRVRIKKYIKGDFEPLLDENYKYFDNNKILAIIVGALFGIIFLADIDYTKFSDNVRMRYIYLLDLLKIFFSAALIPSILNRLKSKSE